MGKFIRKLNRGAIVSYVVLMAVALYLVALNVMQEREKPDIKAVCEAFVQADAAWRVLPVDYQNGETQLTAEEMTQFQSDTASDLGKYFVSNQVALQNYLYGLTQALNARNEGLIPLFTGFDCTIMKFTGFSFEGDTVTVSFETQISIESLNFAAGETSPSPTSGRFSNVISVRKENGTWKIVYANIMSETMGGMY